MTDRGRGLVGQRRTAACDNDAARIVRPEFGGDAPSNDAVTAGNQNIPIIQATAPQVSGAKARPDHPMKSHLKLHCFAPSEIRCPGPPRVKMT